VSEVVDAFADNPPDVTTVHQEISKVVPEGLVGEDGTLYPVDILVCATGFNLAFAPSLYVPCASPRLAVPCPRKIDEEGEMLTRC